MWITLMGMYSYDPDLLDGIELPDNIDRNYLITAIIAHCGSGFPYYQSLPNLKKFVHEWFAWNKTQFKRLADTLDLEYNPIENYDRYEDLNEQKDGTIDFSSNRTGSETNAASKSDKENVSRETSQSETLSETDTGSLSETGTNTTSNTRTNTDSESNDTVNTKATYSSNTFHNYDKSEIDISRSGEVTDEGKNSNSNTASSKTTKTNENARTENVEDSRTNVTDVDETKSKTEEETNKNVSNETTVNTNHIHGNIGVTTAQQMIEAEREVTKFDLYFEIARRFEQTFMMCVY